MNKQSVGQTEFALKDKLDQMIARAQNKPLKPRKITKYEEEFNKRTELAMIKSFYKKFKHYKVNSSSIQSARV
jgi:hypothetical protein